MTYTIHRLDNRFSYRDFFGYYIGFSGSMANRRGPQHFNDCAQWFTDTWGWSAEVRDWMKIWRYYDNTVTRNFAASVGHGDQPPSHCNPHWSWTNGYTDLRIYVATEQELAYFQLAHPVDQK